jgi:hydroxymethylglutaryl-CoA lyase
MSAVEPVEVLIREVGPRDGFQNEAQIIPTQAKLDLVERLAAAGLRWIEVTSFASPKWVPQLADAAEVVEGLRHRDLGDAKLVAFVPNLPGLMRAAEAGVRFATTALTVSDEMNRRNFNKGTDELLASLPALIAAAQQTNIELEVTIGTAFGCVYEGWISKESVLRVATAVAETGLREITLGDTVGVANPRQVRETYALLRRELPDVRFGAHFHDTRGLGVANALAAWEEGISVFDGSFGGLGGCPFAKGATGNVATEELVYMFESMGIRTGVDLERLVSAVYAVEDQLGRTASSAVAKAMAVH